MEKIKFGKENKGIKTSPFLVKMRNMASKIPGAGIVYRKLIKKPLLSLLFGENFKYYMGV